MAFGRSPCRKGLEAHPTSCGAGLPGRDGLPGADRVIGSFLQVSQQMIGAALAVRDR